MQVRIVIGTIAFMLTMIVFGYAALREPARMENWSNASVGRQIEQGAVTYYNNCSSCHGEKGKAEECYGPGGEQIGCAGLPLNHAPLLCVRDGQSERMAARSWEGTLQGYIESTLIAGRTANGMPAWGAAYGGPLEDYQIENTALYIMNWETEEMCNEPTPTPVPWPSTVSELVAQTDAPDLAAGEEAYNITYGCAACHGNIDEAGSNAVGPWSGDLPDVGGSYIDGYNAADYIYESVLLPSNFISPNCPNGPCAGPPSAMPANFGERMSLQDMTNMIGYLLQTENIQGDAVVQYP